MELSTFNQLLSAAVNSGASDIHVKADAPPAIRVHGQLRELRMPALASEDMQRIGAYLTREHQMSSQLHTVRELNLSYKIADVGRFRVTLFRQRGSFAAILHCIPAELPTVRSLGLPPVLEEIAESRAGLILCTGLPGSGRSTTMAAMLQHVNTRLKRHIVTIEDPVEFIFTDQLSRVTQREVGSDTPSYATGLTTALRLDPDVLMVGEITDLAALETLLRAAESGVTAISTLPTPTVAKSVEALLRLYGQDARAIARRRLSRALVAICSQHLVPRADKKGMAAVFEIWRNTPRLAEWLAGGAEGDPQPLLEAESATSHSQSLRQHLQQLQGSGAVQAEDAEALDPHLQHN